MSRKLASFILISSLIVMAAMFSQTTSSQSLNNKQISTTQSERVHNIDTGLNYTTIQEAINAAETLDGHIIFVEEGNYYEHVIVNKSLSLIGEDRDTTIIDGNGTGTVVSLTAQNVSISNFTIMNAGFQAPISGAILLNKTINCIIENIATVDSEPCGIALFDSTHNNISRSESFNNTFFGLLLVNSNENIIVDNVISGHPYAGIGLGGPEGSSNNLLANNRIFGNLHGIDIVGFDNRVFSNRILNNSNGVLLDMANGNLIIANSIANNLGIGVYLIRGSENNTIVGNIVQFNLQGVFIKDYSKNNIVLHNNFINNQAIVETPEVNIWDDGIEGNYWSNYNGTDADHNGIGDTLHGIDANNADNCPLMGMFHSFNASLGYHVNVVSNSTIEDFTYFESNNTIKMHVSNMTTTQTYGFCRICIPYDLMNVTSISVIIDDGDTTVLYPNYTLHENGTHRWIYFAYEHSTHEIVIIPEFPSLIILPLFMIATLLAVIVYKRKHQTRNKKREV